MQEGMEGGARSPGSHYSHWLGSPNSHSNEDFEAWSSIRRRANSDASTLSGRRSPFPSEHDDLAEAEGHMVYTGTPGPKIPSSLPSLSEVTRSMGQRGSDSVMDSLLDNLNLLSPKPSQLGSDPVHSPNVTMVQSAPYCSPGLTLRPQQDYRKCMYGQMRMNSMSPAPMQTLPETKPGFTLYDNQYINPAGLLKELLTSDAEACRDMRLSADSELPQVGVRASCLMPTYNSQGHMGGHNGVKMINPLQSQQVPHANPQAIHSHSPLTSGDLNNSRMIPLTSLTSLPGAPPHVTGRKTCLQLLPRGHPSHAGDVLAADYLTSGGSYRELHPVHPHSHQQQERLPSDLDSVSIERFECDMETVLHDTLMDGGSLDFNFDPTATVHGFPQRVKPTTHSWVPG